MNALLRQPLVQLLLLGAVFFYAYHRVVGAQTDETEIVLSQPALSTYLQYRTKQFSSENRTLGFNRLSTNEQQQLIDDYISDEVLVREAMKLGLDKNDFVIRQRLIQKMRFLLRSTMAATPTLSDEEIAAYYQAHQSQYRKPARYSFNHIYIGSNQTWAKDTLEQLKVTLNQSVSTDDGSQWGEAFPYYRVYNAQSASLIDSHFGAEFTARLDALSADNNHWQGPIHSSLGWHLIKLTEKQPADSAPLQNQFARIKQDAQDAYKQQLFFQAETTLRDGYEIRFDDSDLTMQQGQH